MTILFKKGNFYNRAQIECTREELDKIREPFFVKNKASRYNTYAPTFVNPITATGTFRYGLTESIMKVARQISDDVQITDELVGYINPYRIDKIVAPGNSEFELRPYQKEAVTLALRFGRAILHLATGAGKSVIQANVLNSIVEDGILGDDSVVLLLVPNAQLVNQMYSDMSGYGIGDVISMFSSKKKKIDDGAKIVISNIQWVMGHYDELPNIKALFVDEVHQFANNKSSDFVEKTLMDVPIKFGCTGTLSNKDKMDEYCIEGIIGPVRYVKPVKELQEEGYLTKLRVTPILFEHQHVPYFKANNEEEAKTLHVQEYNYLNSHEEVNLKACSIIEHVSRDKNTLVLFKNIEHGRALFEMLEHDNKHYIAGDIDVSDREEIRAVVEASTSSVIVSNFQCFATGINIKSIDNVVFVAGGTSAIQIIQAIGRGLRLKDGKKFMNLIDIYHNMKYSSRGYHQRLKLYKENYGDMLKEAKCVEIKTRNLMQDDNALYDLDDL